MITSLCLSYDKPSDAMLSHVESCRVTFNGTSVGIGDGVVAGRRAEIRDPSEGVTCGQHRDMAS